MSMHTETATANFLLLTTSFTCSWPLGVSSWFLFRRACVKAVSSEAGVVLGKKLSA